MSRIRPKILNDFYEWMNSHSTLSEATLQSAHFRQTLFPPCDTEEQAQALFSRLVKEYAEKESVNEQLKSTDQMAWVQKMNNIRSRVIEVVNAEVVFV